MSKLVSFESFAAGISAMGMELSDSEVKALAASSGKVDVSSIPASVEVVEYTPKNAKSSMLYATVTSYESGRSNKLHFGRMENLRSDIRKLEALLPALRALEADIVEGGDNTDLPDGWAITGENDKGFVSAKLR